MPLSDDPAVRPTSTDRRALWQRRLQEFVRGAGTERPSASSGARSTAR